MLTKVILAIVSFKGCLASEEVEAAVAETIRRMFPACEVRCLPVADGGEGLLSVFGTGYGRLADSCLSTRPADASDSGEVWGAGRRRDSRY